MKLFDRIKNVVTAFKSMMPVSSTGWISLIREPFTGAWQKNMETSVDLALSNYAAYACQTLISNDIGKLGWSLRELTADGIWQETSSAAFSPILAKPNRFQNHIQFKTWWIMSLLTYGNTYVLKERDQRGVVVAMYILDPRRVIVLIADDGSVYYKLNADHLNTLQDVEGIYPASEIIHDRFNCLFHPLVGVSPLYAAALPAAQGLTIQKESTYFFQNSAKPSGVLSAPSHIPDDTAKRIKEYWSDGFNSTKSGKIAVLGDDLKFSPMSATATDSQLIEQLKSTALAICTAYHVQPFKIGIGDLPRGQTVEMVNQVYYADCLQILIEQMEATLDDGLALPAKYMVQIDVDGLLRMDTATLYKTLGEGIKGSLLTINGARKKINQPPVDGGDSIYMQQQNYSLEALVKRDTSADPFATSKPALPAPAPAPPAPPADANAKELMLKIKQMMEAA